ncbi:chloride channel protein [Sphingobacterium sp. SGL-16]|nr:chloride channel protein [Sphingobacterium sp. SGL-16]
MCKNTPSRRKIIRDSYLSLIFYSIMVSVVCSVLAYCLKHATEYFQELLFERIEEINPLLFIIFPSIGITAIYFLRKYLFKNRKNKGIKEIYTTLGNRKDHLPFYKVPSHIINGFLTVIFGGSTGVEVSTVVAGATVGNQTYKLNKSARAFKTELICAAVAAGVTVLFGSALGGLLFVLEVIARRSSKTLLVSCGISTLTAFIFVSLFDSTPLISIPVQDWHLSALPFILILAILSGLMSLYFTKIVIYAKHYFSNIQNNFLRVNIGAITVGILIHFLHHIYGDSYHGLKEILNQSLTSADHLILIMPLILLIFLKPLASALTLGAGGDGGVFAPSIVTGAFLGILVALLSNYCFGTELIVLNFALFGAVSMLSASIHAPFAALFIVCNLAPNGFVLIVPLLLASLVAKSLAKKLYPYNVYTYPDKVAVINN